ncbi:MAG: hypothetical protein IT437_03330 [Phycisphaerales bacterium]|nr:hypothetical protein [Phycisphaerales bacterium]
MRCHAVFASVVAFAASAVVAQTDSFHLMQIEQAVGGVGGDTAKQAVQLRMRALGQIFLSEGRLRAWDAAGLNPVLLTDFEHDVANGSPGDRVLIVSPGYTSPPVAADYVMLTPIPASYLAAGRLTFEDDLGTVLWSLAWGGANYTGPTTGSLTNCPTGQFGPPFPLPLPTAATSGLLFTGAATAPAGGNATDYAVTAGAAVLTNNARQAGAVSVPCYPDCNNDGALNLSDFGCFTTKFALGDGYADCNGDGVRNLSDFGCFTTKFALGCP